MSTPSFKCNEIAETEYLCKQILVGKLLDYVRQHGKKATWKNCYKYNLRDGEGDRVLKVMEFDSSCFALQTAPDEFEKHRIYCLYVIEDEFGRQFLMFWGDDGRLDYPVQERESLLNKPLAFVNAIADIVKKL